MVPVPPCTALPDRRGDLLALRVGGQTGQRAGYEAHASEAAWLLRLKRPSGAPPVVQVGPASLLHTFLKLSVLDLDTPQLLKKPRSLNRITARRDADLPVDFDRLCAVWPGPVIRFAPNSPARPPACPRPTSKRFSAACSWPPVSAALHPTRQGTTPVRGSRPDPPPHPRRRAPRRDRDHRGDGVNVPR
jgi:hypothetical protein